MAFFKNIFRQLLITLLVISTLSSTLIMPIVHLDFELRREYIYETFCIKKEEPITVCGGTCYLNNRLEDILEQQEGEAEIPVRIASMHFFKQESRALDLTSPGPETLDKKYPHFNSGKIVRFNGSIFRPPRLV